MHIVSDKFSLYFKDKHLSKPIYCFSYFLAKPGSRDELIKALTKLIEPTHHEPGCLQYELLADTENTHFLIMLEKFADQKALDLHEQQTYIKAFVENEMNLLCEHVSWNVAKQIDN